MTQTSWWLSRMGLSYHRYGVGRSRESEQLWRDRRWRGRFGCKEDLTLFELWDSPEEGDPALSLRRQADRVASMIVTSSYTDLECALAERELRMECLRLLPDRMELFDLVYTARFRRLREQFRS